MIAIIARTEAITPKMMVPVKSGLGSDFVVVIVSLLKAASLGKEGDGRVRLEASGAIMVKADERDSQWR